LSCEDVRLDLVPHYRGDLNADRTAAIDTHLRSCGRCREDLAELVWAASLIERHVTAESPSAGTKEGAFALLEAERLGPLLVRAGLWTPPDDLKARALGRAVTAESPPAGVTRLRSRAVPAALAAAAAIALFFAVSYRSQLQGVAADRDRAQEIAQRAEEQVGPPGHPMQTLTLAGAGLDAEVDLFHFRHDNYRIVLDILDMPVTPPDHHYELWLTGERGDVSVGSFRIKSEDRFVNAWVVGVDPGDFPNLVLSVERNDGDPALGGRVVSRAAFDPGHVYHGRYDE
jgi:hypothetical protein